VTQTLDILNLMTDGELMTSARASAAIGCATKSAQNTLWFLTEKKFVTVESRCPRTKMAEYRITAAGMKRAKFQPKISTETLQERKARQDRTEQITEAALDALDRQRAQREAMGAVDMAMQGVIPNSVWSLGSMA